MCRGRLAGGARRRARAAGGRSGGRRSRVARAAAAAVPARAARGGGRHLDRDAAVASGRRPVARRRADRRLAAGARSSSSTCRSASSPSARRADARRAARAPAPAPARSRSARGCSRAPSARSPSASSRATTWGWDERTRARIASPPRSRWGCSPPGAWRATRRRSSRRRWCACARSRPRTPRPSSCPPPSTRRSCATSCSSPRCGGCRCWKPASPSRPAPLVAVIAAGLAPRLAERFGERAVRGAGRAAAGAPALRWFALETGASPRFVGRVAAGHGAGRSRRRPRVPGARQRRAGVGAGRAPRHRDCAVNATARQIGAVARHRGARRDPRRRRRGRRRGPFDRGWTFCAPVAAAVAGVALATGRRRPGPGTVPNHARGDIDRAIASPRTSHAGFSHDSLASLGSTGPHRRARAPRALPARALPAGDDGGRRRGRAESTSSSGRCRSAARATRATTWSCPTAAPCSAPSACPRSAGSTPRATDHGPVGRPVGAWRRTRRSRLRASRRCRSPRHHGRRLRVGRRPGPRVAPPRALRGHVARAEYVDWSGRLARVSRAGDPAALRRLLTGVGATASSPSWSATSSRSTSAARSCATTAGVTATSPSFARIVHRASPPIPRTRCTRAASGSTPARAQPRVGQLSIYRDAPGGRRARARNSLAYGALHRMGSPCSALPPGPAAAVKAAGSLAGMIGARATRSVRNIELFTDAVIDHTVGDPARTLVAVAPSRRSRRPSTTSTSAAWSCGRASAA